MSAGNGNTVLSHLPHHQLLLNKLNLLLIQVERIWRLLEELVQDDAHSEGPNGDLDADALDEV